MRDGNAPREGLAASAQMLTGGRTRTSFHESTLANTIHENSKGGKKARKTWLWLLHAVQDESWTSHPPANQLLNLRKLGTKKWRNLRERCWSTWTSLTSIDVGKKPKFQTSTFSGQEEPCNYRIMSYCTELKSSVRQLLSNTSALTCLGASAGQKGKTDVPHPILYCSAGLSTALGCAVGSAGSESYSFSCKDLSPFRTPICFISEKALIIMSLI